MVLGLTNYKSSRANTRANFDEDIVTEHPHGTRTRYQLTGCRCLPCRASNAQYMRGLRRQHLKGHTPLGTLTTAADARKLVRAFLTECWSKRQLAPQVGVERKTLRLAPDQRIRLKTLLKLRRGYRILMGTETKETNPLSDAGTEGS